MGSLTYKEKRHLPLPKGPYTVGCTDVMTGYSAEGCFIRLYYPCAENDILEHYEQWPLWIPRKEYADAFKAVSELPSVVSEKIIGRLFNNLYIPVIWDSAPLRQEKLHPVVVFSHGLTAFRTTYSANLMELASHGYIVAAVEHRDESACFTYYLKNVESSETSQDTRKDDLEMQPIPLLTKSISSEFFSLRNKQVHQRAEECIRALDLLKEINDGNSPKNLMDTNCDLNQFRGLLDMSKVALIGQSFGGATTLLGLCKEPRFRVGVAFDPWMMPISKEEDLPSRLTQPLLVISSEGFYDKQSMELLEKIRERKIETKYHTIRKTTHYSQCDIPFILTSNVLTRMARWGTKGNSKDKNIHLDIHNKMMISFLSKHLDLPIDAEFQDFLDSNSYHIVDGIVLSQPFHRRNIGTIFVAGLCLAAVITSIVFFRFQ